MTQSADANQQPNFELAYQRAAERLRFTAGFLARTSHELRSPINQIIRLHQLILEDLCEDPAEERAFVAQAFKATQTVLKNLDLLISISKLEIGQIRPALQPLLLTDVLEEVERMTHLQMANRNCRFRLHFEEPGVSVLSDQNWLQQALTMLIDQAIDVESQQIEIRVGSGADNAVKLAFLTDKSLRGDLSENAADAAPPALDPDALADQPIPSFSPALRQYLVEQILKALGGTLQVTDTPNALGSLQTSTPGLADQGGLIIALPSAP